MLLAIETATRHAVVVVGDGGAPAAAVVREVVPGRGTPLLSLLDQVLGEAGATMGDIAAIGVGTGPGSFTGLRSGMATAKTLCWMRGLPLVALPTDETIRAAAALAEPASGMSVAVVLPAGARDHYVALPGADPQLVPPSADLAALIGDAAVAALDIRADGAVATLTERLLARGMPDPVALGATALTRMPEALLRAMEERLATDAPEDLATLVPRYVALPRGIAAVPIERGTTITHTARRDEAWSPTSR
jgi:tRNA threonylcarbamoyl adenosine modification protein YeaZ